MYLRLLRSCSHCEVHQEAVTLRMLPRHSGIMKKLSFSERNGRKSRQGRPVYNPNFSIELQRLFPKTPDEIGIERK